MSLKKTLDKATEGVIIQIGTDYLVVTAYDPKACTIEGKLCESMNEAKEFAGIDEDDMTPGDTEDMH